MNSLTFPDIHWVSWSFDQTKILLKVSNICLDARHWDDAFAKLNLLENCVENLKISQVCCSVLQIGPLTRFLFSTQHRHLSSSVFFRYELALASPTLAIFSTPYIDGGGAGNVISISQALLSPSSTKVTKPALMLDGNSNGTRSCDFFKTWS